MMHHEWEKFKYYECPHLNTKFLELPFIGNKASIIFVLPTEINALSSLEQQIERVFVPHNFTSLFLHVAIPKFKIKTKIDIKNLLTKLGIKKIFNEREADISEITGEKGDLFVDKVIQKTFIDVNEGGAEGAAATYGDLSRKTISRYQFIADHPFIFYIKL